MLALFNKVEKYFWLIVLLSTSIFYLNVSLLANDFQRQISDSNSFLEFLYSANNFVAFCIPLIAYIFFAITTKIMLFVVDLNMEHNYEENIEINEMLGYSFIPLLIFMLFYFSNLAFHNSDIDSIKDLEQMSFIFNLTFSDFKILSYISWGLIYIVLLIQLVLNEKIDILKSALIVFLPSLILYGFKLLFGYL